MAMYRIEKRRTGTESRILTENQTLTKSQILTELKMLRAKRIDKTRPKNNILVKSLSKTVAVAVKAEEKEKM
jgi:hypothetical protein